MPTLADLQALRQQSGAGTPDPGIQLSGSDPSIKKPTLADLQALRDKQSAAPEIPSAPTRPDMATRVAGIVAAPGFALTGLMGDSGGDTLKKGVSDIPGDTVKDISKDAQSAVANFKTALSPDTGIEHRVVAGGKGALDALAIPFTPITRGIENTYGRLASEGSRMADPTGQNRTMVSPQMASVLPGMLGGGATAAEKTPNTLQASAARLGINLSKAKSAEDIAKELTRATDAHADKVVSGISPTVPVVSGINKPGSIATNALGNFTARKAEESKLWQGAETAGTQIPISVDPEVNQLHALRDSVVTRISNGEDTPDVKKSLALIDRTLGELGSPRAGSPRAANAGDLVRARRAGNETIYASADPKVVSEVKNVLGTKLTDVSKTNPSFGQQHQLALRKTQANADIYRDDAKAAKFGFDEETLSGINAKLKLGRDLSTDVLQKINSGVDHIKTPEDLLFLQRHLDKPTFATALRAKTGAVLDDVGMDYDKIQKQRPMLEKLFEFSGMAKPNIKQKLDDMEAVAKEADRYGIASRPQVDPSSTSKLRKMAGWVGAATFGPKSLAKKAVQGAIASPNSDALALQAYGRQLKPKTIRDISGPAVGAALGGQRGPDQ